MGSYYRRMKHVRGAQRGRWWGVVRRMREASSHLLTPILYLYLPPNRASHSSQSICTHTILSTPYSPHSLHTLPAGSTWTALQLTLCLSLSPSLHSATFTLETDSFRFAGFHGGAAFVELLVHALNIPLDFAALLVPYWPSLVTLGM